VSNHDKNKILIFSITIFQKVLLLIPDKIRLYLLQSIFYRILSCSREKKGIFNRNMELAYPEFSQQERLVFFRKHTNSLAVLFNDIIRMDTLSLEWVDRYVDTTEVDNFLKSRTGQQIGALFVTGHIGSFELIPLVLLRKGVNLNFVARELKPQALSIWWNIRRTRAGSVLINREGALLSTLKTLKKGLNVAILFDQNVTRKNAFFVNWFGHRAATTKLTSYLALKTGADVYIIGLLPKATFNTYKMIMRKVEYEINEDHQEVTQRFVDGFIELIKEHPESWFWLHRRWKTQPTDAEEVNYINIKK
jgi:Kdo2-lipid IVA lauroyltransferase/acyltransferase